ncbi:hypothetical protein V2J09_009462 [Rumex salicifolius]
MLRSRRRPRYGPQLFAVAAALLLLLSVSLLYSRLVSDHRPKRPQNDSSAAAAAFVDAFTDDPLLRDSDPDITRGKSASSLSSDDRIDELDVLDDDSDTLRESQEQKNDQLRVSSSSSSGYYFDHLSGTIRRAFDKRSIDQLDGWDDQSASFLGGLAASDNDGTKVAYGSDDIPVDEEVRRKIIEVKGIEDALLLKFGSRVSPLRKGWGPWFDAKSDFLRKDRMFKSNLEMVNPLTNPLLQDPDGIGVTGLTRGDKIVLKGLLNDFRKVAFLGKKTLEYSGSKSGLGNSVDNNPSEVHNIANHVRLVKDSSVLGRREHDVDIQHQPETKRIERSMLNEISSIDLRDIKSRKVYSARRGTEKEGADDIYSRNVKKTIELTHRKPNLARNLKDTNSIARANYDIPSSMYPDGKTWGYFPGIPPRLPFSKFMASFFRKGKCSMRVFMVWNSPPWMYGVRHQRCLESLLFHHLDACVIIFSETVELDFFKEFAKDGFKVAVVMPNLEELLKATPTSIFASVWYEWRKTKFYSTHYSELVRLAALYKYGGVYLDADVIVLRPISSLKNTVGMEDIAANSPLNGAVMAFRKNSPFIEECLLEFYASYDDTLLRWNGADLLTRVAGNFSATKNASSKQLELKVQHKSRFFPISSQHIARYLKAPATDVEKAHQDALFGKILNESYTFHLWDSVTSAIVPDPDSLVARVINHHCIRCLDVL